MGALHLAVGAGCCCCHGNGMVGRGWGEGMDVHVLVVWEWDGGGGSPVRTLCISKVHTCPSPPLSPINQALYPCSYTLYISFPALYAIT